MNEKDMLERLKATLWFAENDNMLSATIWTSDLKEIVELLKLWYEKHDKKEVEA